MLHFITDVLLEWILLVDLTSNVERFLDAQISLIVIFTTH